MLKVFVENLDVLFPLLLLTIGVVSWLCWRDNATDDDEDDYWDSFKGGIV